MTVTDAPGRRRLVRVARLITLAVALGWALYVLASWFLAWNPADAGAYYDAAARLVAGDRLYAPMHPDAHEVYRYAPWFAYAWIPLVSLPRDIVLHAWSLAMLGCSAIAVWPLFRRGTPATVALGALLGAFLAETAMFGNAHPAVVAMLVVTARSRWLPMAVAIAASIKLVPILFVSPWVRSGEWQKALVALGAAALLWAPALLFDLTGYETNPGTGLLSFYAVSPVLWVALAVLAGSAALLAVARQSRWAWIAIGLFMFVGPPRVALSYLGFLIPAIVMTWAAQDAENRG